MSRLVRLECVNFQPHKDRTIAFDPYVTVLVGPNGRGKSSIIRAIRWVAFNRPLGDGLIRWGAKSASVKLVTETAKVTREKSGDENLYRIGSRNVFRAFGTGVPDGVSKALRLEEVNFQKQIEAGFWFVHSAPEVAREMNRVVDLSLIDTSQSYAAGRVKATNADIRSLEGLLEEAQVKKASLSWVPRAEMLMRDADRIASARDTALRRLEGMESLLEEIKGLKTRRAQIPDTTKVEVSIKELQEAWDRLEGIESLLSQINKETEGLEQCRIEIKALEEQIELTRPELCPTCGSVIQTGR